MEEKKKKTSKRYSAEVRERAVRLLREVLKDHASEWAAIKSISSKIGCSGAPQGAHRRGCTAGVGCGRPNARAVAATA